MKDKLQNIENNDIFFENVALLIEQARKNVARTVDIIMCVTYFEIGRMIVEREQQGKSRAEYGKGLIIGLSEYLTNRLGKGFSVANLKNIRKFYLLYFSQIRQQSSAELQNEKSQSMISLFENTNLLKKSQSQISQFYPFNLSWTHYLILIRIKNDEERSFYEIEAINQQWTLRQLQRQW